MDRSRGACEVKIIDLYTGQEESPPFTDFPTMADAAYALTALVGAAILAGKSASYAIVDEDDRVLRVVTTSCFVVAG